VEIIRKNFGLKLLAVILAIIGWAYFRFAANPAFIAHFKLNPPPTIKTNAATDATNAAIGTEEKH
jgi:hypothetical protein